MFGLTKIRLGGYLAAGLAIAVFVAWAFRSDHLRAEWKSKYEVLSSQAGEVLYEIRTATGDQKMKWQDATGGVRAIVRSRDEWKSASETQSNTIRKLGDESARLKALNAELRRKAEIEITKRRKLYAQLDEQAQEPGDRADLIGQIKAVEAALDAIYEEGF